jgi:hypothetical protein
MLVNSLVRNPTISIWYDAARREQGQTGPMCRNNIPSKLEDTLCTVTSNEIKESNHESSLTQSKLTNNYSFSKIRITTISAPLDLGPIP